MGLPIFLPAIAKGAAAISSILGLSAIAAASKEEHEPYGDLSLPSFSVAPPTIPLIIAGLMDRAKKSQPTSTNIPTAENALVLRPEYRTVSLPASLNWSGFKPLQNEQSSTEESQQTGAIAEETVIGGTPDPEDEKDKKIKELEEKLKQLESKPKNDGFKNEKGFKKGLQKGWGYTKNVGRIGVNGIGIGLGVSPLVGVPAGIYYGGKALGWWGKDSNDSSNEIDTVATRKNNSDKIYIAEIAE